MPQTTDISKNVSTLRQMLEYYMWSSICLKPLTFFKHLPTTTDIFFENVTSCRQMLAHSTCGVQLKLITIKKMIFPLRPIRLIKIYVKILYAKTEWAEWDGEIHL